MTLRAVISGGGSSGLTIGVGATSITGGTAGRVLFESGSPVVLSDSASFTYNTTAGEGLTVGGGTATTDVAAYSGSQTWNNAAVTFTGAYRFAITDPAANAGSAAASWHTQFVGGVAGATGIVGIGKVANSAANPALRFAGDATSGWYSPGAGFVAWSNGGTATFSLMNSHNGAQVYTSHGYMWGAGDATSAVDTSVFRPAAGIVAPSTGDNSTLGRFKASNFIATGAAASNGAGTVAFGGTTQTTIGANGAASALTASPLGYITVNVAGTAAIIPYYNA